jgi:methyltransferase (TIGR00027 family)
MQESKGSVTSLVTAFARAYHSLNASSKIFDDYLARTMFSDEHWAYMEQNLAGSYDFFNPVSTDPTPSVSAGSANPRSKDKTSANDAISVSNGENPANTIASTPAGVAPTATGPTGEMPTTPTLNAKEALSWVMRVMMAPTTISRSRYTEDNLEKAIANGVRQYVILGAGMDTFAFRRPDLLSKIQVFELDHPATQAHKLSRISELGWEIPAHLHFVPIDFSKDGIAEALKKSQYDPGKLSYFSWLGVVYYLANDVVLDLLHAIAGIASPGSLMVFDYPENESLDPGKVSEKMRLTREIVRNAGEPMKGGFDPVELSGYLEKSGWLLRENLSPADIEELYFKGRDDGYHATGQTYFALAEAIGKYASA